jgi:hypothetical protein
MDEETNNADTSKDPFESGWGKVAGATIVLVVASVIFYFAWYRTSIWLYDYFLTEGVFSGMTDPNQEARMGFLVTFIFGVTAQIMKSFIEKPRQDGVSFLFGMLVPMSLIGFYWSGAYSYVWNLFIPEAMQGNILGGFTVIFFVLIYFLPTIVAVVRSHHNKLAIGFTNTFLGWTLIGWVVAIIWAGTAVKIPANSS